MTRSIANRDFGVMRKIPGRKRASMFRAERSGAGVPEPPALLPAVATSPGRSGRAGRMTPDRGTGAKEPEA